MSEGNVKRKNVGVMDFAVVVREAAINGTGIDGIVEATGLKRTTVSTKLNSLRKTVGKENVPSFKKNGKKKTDAAAVLAILQGK
jgi:hypothetical protein